MKALACALSLASALASCGGKQASGSHENAPVPDAPMAPATPTPRTAPEPAAEPAASKPAPLDLPDDLASTPVYVVLPEDVLIRRRPAKDSPVIAARRHPSGWIPGLHARPSGAGQLPDPGILARVHARHEEYLEVETLPGATRGVPCHPQPRWSPYQLRGFVPGAAPLTVLRADLERSFDDGTSLELPAGVPVERVDGLLRVALFNVELALPLTERDVGRWFSPAALQTRAASAQVQPTDPKNFLLDEGKIAVSLGRAPLRIEATEPQGHYSIENDCLRMTAKVAEGKPETFIGIGSLGRIGHGGGGGQCSFARGIPHWDVAANTEIFWPDGSPAGKALTAHRYLCNEPKRSKGKLCLHTKTSGGVKEPTNEVAPVCFDEASLEQLEANALRQGYDPRVTVGKTSIKGRMSKAQVGKTIRRHVNELTFCYEGLLRNQPKTQGALTLSFRVSPQGAVQDVAAVSGLRSQALRACVLDAFGRWQFPPGKDAANVSVQLDFRAAT